ncbi:hypothetical protein GCM10011375_40130 [Hymenobacter qilianensis]|uniref:Uncharacterized protein n=1 Tax=Hymenobacter qilianensis TaxID=1385715 RepID=A0ACB5PXD0_9BACT|nr:DUF6660 family protein [Hymenobacter qilianensis]GGF81131.1 hypothetical protein GCM10011375_40130 [Hymenobacter qilianensis]
MRFLSIFFACYLAVLACLPCVDREPVRADNLQTLVTAASQQQEAGTHAGLDWCTPMCQCQCCASTSLPLALGIPLIVQPRTYYAPSRFARLAPPGPRHLPGTIWQPPQA